VLITDDGVVHHIVEDGPTTSDEHATRWQHADPGDEA
jgi:hypothetical protein